MKTVSATLDPFPDGSIHLPIPPELRDLGRLRVVAWLELDSERPPLPGAGQWAREARGIAIPSTGETTDDSRMKYLRGKFGVK